MPLSALRAGVLVGAGILAPVPTFPPIDLLPTVFFDSAALLPGNGSIIFPYKTIEALAGLPSGTVVGIWANSVFKPTSEIVISQTDLKVVKIGIGADPVIDRMIDIKGSASDWSDVTASDYPSTPSGLKVWRRSVVNSGQHMLLLNDNFAGWREDRDPFTFTGSITGNVLTVTSISSSHPLGLGTPLSGAGVLPGTVVGAQLTNQTTAPGGVATYAVQNHATPTGSITVTAAVNMSAQGRWLLPVAGSNFVDVVSASNPASFYSSIKLTGEGNVLNEATSTRFDLRGITLQGAANGRLLGNSPRGRDFTVRYCAGYGMKRSIGGDILIYRPKVRYCGGSSVTDHEDYESNAYVEPGATSGAPHLYTGVIWDADFAYTRDDVVHRGGNSGGIDPASLTTFKSSTPGATRIGGSHHGENVIDNNQYGSGQLVFEGAYIFNNSDPSRPEVAPTSLTHDFGDGVILKGCILNARHIGPQGFALRNRRGGQEMTVVNSLVTGMGSAGATDFVDGGVINLVGSVIYANGLSGAGAQAAAVRITDGKIKLLRSTMFGGTGFNSITAARSVATVTIGTRSASPVNGFYEYPITCSNGTSYLMNGRIKIGGLTSTSAPVNGYREIKDWVQASTSSGSGKLLVAAADNPPTTVSTAGLVVTSLPTIDQMAGNLMAGPQYGALIGSPTHLIDGGVYNSNCYYDTSGSDTGLRVNGTVDPFLDSGSNTYTKSAITADAATVGNAIKDTGGKIGGSSNAASDTDGDPFTLFTPSAVVVAGGECTVSGINGHGLTAGMKGFLRGANIEALNYGHFVKSATASSVTFLVEETVPNGTVSGTMTYSNLQPAAISGGVGSFPLPDVSAFTTTDLQGRPIAANGNFGAVQAA